MANVILDHSTPVQQSLNKLNRRANRLNIQIGKLKTQSKFQIAKINKELEKERRQPRKFLPLYDQAKFTMFIQRRLKKFNKTLLRVFLETRQFEHVLQEYNSIISSLK
jgi:hypothetical protein